MRRFDTTNDFKGLPGAKLNFNRLWRHSLRLGVKLSEKTLRAWEGSITVYSMTWSSPSLMIWLALILQ